MAEERLLLVEAGQQRKEGAGGEHGAQHDGDATHGTDAGGASYRIAIRPLTDPAYRQLGFVLRSRENASLAMKRFLQYLDARNDTQT